MEAIGGYFELELNDFGSVYHNDAIAVNTGRNALEYILRAYKCKKIFIPYYTCDVTLEPINKLDVDYEFYYLNKDFTPKLNHIKEDEVILFVNYFGLFDSYIALLKKKYKNIIVDNSQAFYAKPINRVPTFYSPRKFFGLPDGGFVYSNKKLQGKLETDNSVERFLHLIKRIENSAEAGFEDFKQNDAKLHNLPLLKMSKLTYSLLRNINFEYIRQKRNNNFNFLHKALKEENELSPIIEKTSIDVPMIYPFLKKGNDKLREQLISKKIFIAKYWPNVLDWIDSKDIFEKHLYDDLIPLPIDQRYYKEDIKYILNFILH